MASKHILRLRTDEPDFLEQVDVQAAKVAAGILVEAAATPWHNLRLDWARRVLANPRFGTDMVIWAVVSNSAIAAVAQNPGQITDAMVEAAVAAVLDGFLIPLRLEVAP